MLCGGVGEETQRFRGAGGPDEGRPAEQRAAVRAGSAGRGAAGLAPPVCQREAEAARAACEFRQAAGK